VGGAIAAAVFLVVLIVLAFINGQLVVDIILVLTALVSLVAFALLGYAALQVVALVKEVRGEVHTLIGTAKETMAEVQGTARFVNSAVVNPVSQAAGWVSATRATMKSFTEPLYKRRG
jgi:hypothetical protein